MLFTQAVGFVALTVTASATPVHKVQRDFGDFQADMLAATNFYRQQHDAVALTWNQDAANNAQDWANQCQWSHQGDNQYGENLAAGGFSSLFDVVNMWGGERVNYDWNNPGFYENTGHFTQLVWKGTTSMGCAYKDCGDGSNGGASGTFVVCEYSPFGNIVGDDNQYFRDNVGPQTSGSPTDTYQG